KVAYIAFNKSVQLEADGRMPDNVEARTGHSIAYTWAPDWMKDRTRDKAPLRRPDAVARHLGINEPLRTADGTPLSTAEQAQAVMRTIDRFANSADPKIMGAHLPEHLADLPGSSKIALLTHASKAWEDL